MTIATRAGLVALAVQANLCAATPADQEKYSPYPEDQFPQIIQHDDYPTVECIEALFHALSKIATTDTAKFGKKLACEVSPDSLTFHPPDDAKKKVVVKLLRDDTVLIAGKPSRIAPARCCSRPPRVCCEISLTTPPATQCSSRSLGLAPTKSAPSLASTPDLASWRSIARRTDRVIRSAFIFSI